ncbi:hypothetical protein B296_00037652 [Ensete ventricosum]|uniref:Uncharacterized protein n=1 Tax=Ensete ventricosum TaxID=4639 RepID=A0A426ZYT6_ENSVE|nr:hypothetical protein B296_00037652 [Ensete ventricosum]
MARLGSGKQTPRKCVFLLSCVVFLAIVLLADFLWVSSSSSPSDISPPSSFSYWPTSFDLSLGLSTPKAKQGIWLGYNVASFLVGSGFDLQIFLLLRLVEKVAKLRGLRY